MDANQATQYIYRTLNGTLLQRATHYGLYCVALWFSDFLKDEMNPKSVLRFIYHIEMHSIRV